METIDNLAKAFVGESQARNRYTFYASAARKEGLELVAATFELTANQEKEHANWLMKLLNQLKKEGKLGVESIKIEAEVPHVLASTVENLKAAIGGENFEHTSMYPGFAETAEKDGYPQIAARLRSIAKAEAHHEERYQKLVDLLEKNQMFKRDIEIHWICRECGYEHIGLEAPSVCPSCDHAQSFYEKKNEEY